MSKAKRAVALLLCISMVIGLAACGKPASDDAIYPNEPTDVIMQEDTPSTTQPGTEESVPNQTEKQEQENTPPATEPGKEETVPSQTGKQEQESTPPATQPGKEEAAPNSSENQGQENNNPADSENAGQSATDQMDREDKELVVELVGGQDGSSMTDEELDEAVDQLIQENVGNSGVTNLGDNQVTEQPPMEEPADPDVYEEDGSMNTPFDQVYPELIEQEQVRFSGESILIKMAGGTLTAGLKAAGVGTLEKIVPMGDYAWYEAKLVEGTDAQEALAAVRELDEVLLAEYNYEVEVAALDEYESFTQEKEEVYQKNSQYKEQWHFHHCGIVDGYEKMTTNGGESGVVVAVIDTGVDYDHEDLKDNMWVNTAEIPDNGIDDDKNGYIDDYYGIDIVAGKGNGDDTNGHGTHVAGIIAARNNNVGVVGIAYNVKIMTVKAAGHNGIFNQADIAKAILYAYEMGAEVINMSFGGVTNSLAVQDALATAYSRCVLVASAGNDGRSNEPNQINDQYLPNYPAALTYVLGVMSVDSMGVESVFTNWDVTKYNGVEYELYAPGENIMSTLPGNQYGYLSGTSMAAPVVSAFAAILRSEFADRDQYPTKFIYGQLVSTSGITADCMSPQNHGKHNLPQVANLYDALTKLPKPDLNVQDFAIFDDPKYSSKNNGDGIIDAGETIALGLTIRNRWGMSENTVVKIDTISANSGKEDPYFTIQNPEVNYGSVGTYSTQDCGKIYTGLLHTGWENPFLITVSEDCPNDYRFTLNVTITCENGVDTSDDQTYTFDGRVDSAVRSGYVLPAIIDEDMVLTADTLYIIPYSTVINEGVTVRVEPGTHIQFWGNDADDPYADSNIAYLRVNGTLIAEGTKEAPIYIYPSELMWDYNIELSEGYNGSVSLIWCDITNLCFYPATYNSGGNTGYRNEISLADHCTFRLNTGLGMNIRYISGTTVNETYTDTLYMGIFEKAVDCVFYRIGAVDKQYNNPGIVYICGDMQRCIFVDCGLSYWMQKSGSTSYCTFADCVFLGGRFYDQTKPDVWVPSNLTLSRSSVSLSSSYMILHYNDISGTTYLRYRGDLPAEYLEYVGAHALVIDSAEEMQWLVENRLGQFAIVLKITYDAESGCYCWHDGTEVDPAFLSDELKAENAPIAERFILRNDKIVDGSDSTSSVSDYYLYEFPDAVLPTDIRFVSYEIPIDMEATYAIHPLTDPAPVESSQFIYETSDEEVLTVDKNGVVTPVGLGTADVTVYSKDKAVWNYITFHVKEKVPLEGIAASVSDVILVPGDTVTMECVLTPADTTKAQIAYTSDNTSAATVSAAGEITAVAPGTATITASCEGMTAAVTVEVGYAAESLAFANSAAQYVLGSEDVQLPKLHISQGAHTVLVWESSDKAVADVEDGALVLNGAGVTQLKVTDLRSGLADTITLYVQPEGTVPLKVFEIGNGPSFYALFSDGKLYYWTGQGNLIPELLKENVVAADVRYNKYAGSGQIRSCELIAYADGTVEVWNNKTLAETWDTFKNQEIIDVSFAGFDNHRYVHLADGSVYVWGTFNYYGQYGTGTTDDVTEPFRIPLEVKVTKMAPNSSTTALLAENGNLYILGGSETQLHEPTLLARNVTDIGDGWYVSEGKQYFYDGTTIQEGIDISAYDKIDLMKNGSEYLGLGWRDGMLYTLNCYVSDTAIRETAYRPADNVTYVRRIHKDACYYVADGVISCFGNEYDVGYPLYGVSADAKAEPSAIPVPNPTNDVLALTETNLDNNGLLNSDALELTFNKPLRRASVILHEDGVALNITASIEGNRVIISNALGFAEGMSYDVVISAENTAGIHEIKLAEDVNLAFMWKKQAAQEQTQVIHEAQTDSSVVRGWTVDSMYAALVSANEALRYNAYFNGNVILNRVSADTDVTHWMRPTTGSSSNINAADNWWGTADEDAIELQIVDKNDIANYGYVYYKPYLTQAPENTFPFVTEVKLINKNGDEITVAGNEEVTFRVTFNRDMDTSIPLDVRFGSAYPYGDYEVAGAYTDARTWEGKYTLNTLIENGEQYFMISNGWSATEDLELQPDEARFRFAIDTTAAQALIMKGDATDTGIKLSWTQDDFDTLMGYNVYRSTAEDGLYTKLNKTVIPADTMSFFDDTVEPGVIYYYNFTVVKTDLSESEPSGKISIRSKDTMAPNVYHSPISSAFTGANLVISATVTDNMHVSYANLYYRIAGTEVWKIIRMNNLNDKYSAIVPASYVTTDGLQYYIEAFDGVSYTYKGSAEEPYSVFVQEAVDANSLGDVNGDGAITNLDALLVLYTINDKYNMKPEEFARADLNGDGVLKPLEAVQILRYVAGLEGSLKM